ncbi:MAG: hypothetical protein R3E01_28285 [Pirellulaceae bacterium]
MNRLRQSLRAGREQIYAPRGNTRLVNRILRDIGETKTRLRESVVRPMLYEQVVGDLKELRQQLQQQQSALAEARRNCGHFQRMIQALPTWLRSQMLRDELQQLNVPAELRGDQCHEVADRLRRLQELQQSLARAEAECSEIDTRRSALERRPECLDAEPLVQWMMQQVARMHGLRDELPRLRQQIEATDRELLEQVRHLQPDWGPEKLDAFAATLPQTAAFESLQTQWQRLERQRSELQLRLPRVEAECQRLEERLSQLANPGEVTITQFEEVLAGQGQFLADVAVRDEAASQLQKLDAEITRTLSRLEKHVRARFSDPDAVPIPPLEASLHQFKQQFQELQQQTTRHQDRDDQLRNELEGREAELKQLDASTSVPDREELERVRAIRDVGWQLIRSKYVRRKNVDDEIERWLEGVDRNLVDQFEQRLHAADRMADRRQEHAEVVARRDQLFSEVEQLRRQLGKWEIRGDELQQQLVALQSEWRDLWSTCGVTPLSPPEMLDWLRVYSELLDLSEERRNQQKRHRDACDRLGDLEDDLRGCIPLKLPVSKLFGEAQKKLDQLRDNLSQRVAIEEQLQRQQVEFQQLQLEQQQYRAEVEAWSGTWQGWLESVGFPPGWGVETVEKVLRVAARAQEMRLLNRQRGEQSAAMAAEIQRFESQVTELALRWGTVSDGVAEDQVVRMGRILDAAREAEAMEKELSSSQTQLHATIAAARSEMQVLQAAVARWYDCCRVENDAQLVLVLQDALKRDQLREQMEQQLAQVHAVCGTEDRQAFCTELATADVDSLEQRQMLAQTHLDQLEVEYAESIKREAVLQKQLDEMGRAEEATALQMELEEHRARLSVAVDQWAPFVLAESLLRSGLERFEREHQPYLLGEAQRLLARITDGRYVELRAKLDEQGTLLVREENGQWKEPTQLSRGTREQLYLAIRLAYVQHYRQHAESLPLVLDDILVNFDDRRAENTLDALIELAEHQQILFLTCHEKMVERVCQRCGDVAPIDLATGVRYAGQGMLSGNTWIPHGQ